MPPLPSWDSLRCCSQYSRAAPNDTFGGKSHIERRWNTTFINAAGLTRYHGKPEDIQNRVPRSWLLTFTDGSDTVTARCYLHGDEFAPAGWYVRSDRLIKLSMPFRISAGSPGARAPGRGPAN